MKWISVKDHLPNVKEFKGKYPDWGRFLVIEDDFVDIALYGYFSSEEPTWQLECSRIVIKPTHWMPMPEVLEESEKV